MTRLETKDLFLQKAVFEDWQALYRNLWSRPESAKYMLWNVTASEEEARQRMRRTLEYQTTRDAFTVYEKASGQAIGFAGMTEVSPGIYEDTGIAVGPEFTGKGYGKQILTALTTACFSQRHAAKFICSCRSENIASKRLQLSCGFQFHHCEERIDRRTQQAYVLEFYEQMAPGT